MKVIQINAVYGYGSTGVIVKDIESLLLENGFEAGVAYQKANVLPPNGWRVGNPIDWKLHAFYTRLSGKQAYASLIPTKKLILWLDKEKPDIIHLHNLHSNYIHLNALLKYIKRKNICTVITLHDCWFFTGKCFHYVESDCKLWQTGCHDCPRNKLDVKSWIVDASRRMYDDKKKNLDSIPDLTVVGCSDWISSEAQKSLLSSKRIYRIYNGVDTAIFAPDAHNYREKYKIQDKFVILGMASKWLCPQNAKIMQSVLDSLLGNDLLLLLGCNEEQISSLSSELRIRAVGYIKDPYEMASLYASSDVFVNLTLADTLPTVNMEAISCGTPVITYDVGGSPELIDEGKTGFIITQQDAQGLIEAIHKVRLGKISRLMCRETAMEKFDKEKNYRKYLHVYFELLARREDR